MLSVSSNGNTLPINSRTIFDEITKPQLFEHNALIMNVIFDSFMQVYPSVQACGSNFVFRPHAQAYDSVAPHILAGCSCLNCDSNSFAKCDANDPQLASWMGGCGDMVCTGKSNYIISDKDGGFLTFKGVIIPNSVIGEGEASCSYSSPMNGYVCAREDFTTLLFESIAPDYKTRAVWPISIIG